MEAEVMRLVHAALADATNGVNAKIAALTLDSSIAGVTDTRPANPTIKNGADHDLGIREADASFPLILIDVRRPAEMQGYATSGVRDGTLTVTVSYLVEGGVTAKNRRDTGYTLRAIAQSLHAMLWAGNGSDAARKRNSVAIKNAPTMSTAAPEQSSMGGVMMGGYDLTFNVRDFLP